jgi:hypothetical protein
LLGQAELTIARALLNLNILMFLSLAIQAATIIEQAFALKKPTLKRYADAGG